MFLPYFMKCSLNMGICYISDVPMQVCKPVHEGSVYLDLTSITHTKKIFLSVCSYERENRWFKTVCMQTPPNFLECSHSHSHSHARGNWTLPLVVKVWRYKIQHISCILADRPTQVCTNGVGWVCLCVRLCVREDATDGERKKQSLCVQVWCHSFTALRQAKHVVF